MTDLVSIARKLSKQPYLGEPKSAEPLAPDVSPRRYARIHYVKGEFPTALLLQLVEGFGPLGGGPREVSQSDAFVEVQKLFQLNGIRVPQIFADARDEGYLLLEDFGERPLWNALESWKEDGFDPILRIDASDYIREKMHQAIALLVSFRALSPDLANLPCIVFEKQPSIDQLLKGPKEFTEYFLAKRSPSKRELTIFDEFTEQLSEEVLSHPKYVSHYDFISHNVHVLADSQLGVIDFQDACLESPARDIHAILCDRGMDLLLGESLHRELMNQAFQDYSGGGDIRQMYSEYAVHWDMRVAGRFTKLANEGRERYAQWIPGTAARVLRGLERIHRKFERAGDLIEIIRKYEPEVSEQATDLWEF
ncbi:MAG: phosphotransferase [Bdellovibrionales bacterium]|nr:phosphotransferase [Bdellovibrionales bacterium]